MIELKNINLDNISAEQQYYKVFEELHELKDAEKELYYEYLIYGSATKQLKDHYIEELLDVLQVGIGFADKMGISIRDIEEHYNNNHLEKLKHRPR